MASRKSSTAFGDKMGEGWNAGLHGLYSDGEFVVRLNWEVTTPRGQTLGDIDFAVSFQTAKTLPSILPVETKIPVLSRTLTAQMFFAEIKRSCNDNFNEEKIDQFISFYDKLLDPANSDNISRRNWPKFLKVALDDPQLVLLFVFNGEDNVRVERLIREKLGGISSIHGRKVVPIWCASEQLILWNKMQEMERMEVRIQDLERQLRDAQHAQQRPQKRQRTR